MFDWRRGGTVSYSNVENIHKALQYTEDLRCDGHTLDPSVTTALVGQMLKMGKFSDAVNFIQKCDLAVEIDDLVFNHAFDTLAFYKSSPSLMIQLLHLQIRAGIPLTKNNCRDCAAILARNGATDDLQRLLQWLRDSNVISEAVPMNLRSVLNSKSDEPAMNVDELEEYFDTMQSAGLVADAKTYYTMIKAISKLRCAPQRAEIWFERMLAAGFQPGTACFSSLISGYSYRPGGAAKAEEWFYRMNEFGLKLNEIPIKILVRMYASGPNSNIKRAEHWFEEIYRQGLTPSVDTFNIMIGSAISHKDVKFGEKYFTMLEASGHAPTEPSYGLMIRACTSAAYFEKAKGWYRRMCSDGHTPSKRTLSAIRTMNW